MKVLLINAESGFGGGPALIVNGIAKAVNDSGNESIVAYGRQGDPNSGIHTYTIGNKKDIYAHVLLTRFTDAHGFGSYYATKKFIKMVEQFKPDIVNLHNIHGYYINIKILFNFLSRMNIPIVWTFHDCWPLTGHCAYFDRAHCKKWKTGCFKCPQVHDYPKSYVDRSRCNYIKKKALFTTPSSLTVVTPSKWLEGLVEQSFLAKYPCETIHNGIDLKKYYPIKSDWKEQHGKKGMKMILGVAAYWTERKGLFDLIRIEEKLEEEYFLTIVGLSQEQLEKLPKNVIGIKRTENVEELVKIYTAADVFVNTSIEDNFPTVILEALACGTPVVTYDTGGCKEALDDNCGFAVPQGDINAMVERIRIAASLSSVACLNRIKEFDDEKQYLKYVNLFEGIIRSVDR